MKNNLTHGERLFLGICITLLIGLAIAIISLIPWFFAIVAAFCAISYVVGYVVEKIDDYIAGRDK